MKALQYILLTLAASIIASSCVAQKSKTKEKEDYSENLSKVLPLYSYNLDSLLVGDTSNSKEEVLITHYAINDQIEPLLDSITTLNKNIKYIRGYRVLVFSGNTQEDALEVRKAILEIFEKQENKEFKDCKVDFIYHQPMFRIKVGEYSKRLDAVRMAEFLKNQKFDFGEESKITVNPLVVPDNIEIRK